MNKNSEKHIRKTQKGEYMGYVGSIRDGLKKETPFRTFQAKHVQRLWEREDPVQRHETTRMTGAKQVSYTFTSPVSGKTYGPFSTEREAERAFINHCLGKRHP